MGQLTSAVALVTGGTSGIGAAAAVQLAAQGATVIVSGRRAEEGAAVVQKVVAAGGKGAFIAADVSREADIQKLFVDIKTQFGRLDIAVNNAGVEDTAAPFHLQTAENFDKVMGVNVRGLWRCMQEELKMMVPAGRGAIVNTASVAGQIGFPNNATYTASKHAVIGFTRAAALECAKQGVRVNAVAPGAIETEMITRFAADPQVRAFVESLHPMGRLGRAEEIAAAIVWLCSPQASFVTGSTLNADGGFTAI